jgi:NhaA family Na+:H+ antiporter
LRIAELPSGLTWRHLTGVALLGGIGFTMSLFIATLSFGHGSAPLHMATQSVMLASLLAGAAGFVWLRWIPGPVAASPAGANLELPESHLHDKE